MQFSIIPYNVRSASAKLLKRTLQRKGHSAIFLGQTSPRVDRLLSEDRTLTGHNFILWGGTTLNGWVPPAVMTENNRFFGTGTASHLTNKREFFNTFRSSDIVSPYLPRVFYNLDDANSFLHGANQAGTRYPVLVERQVLNGTNGDGILFLKNTDTATRLANLWTQYIRKTHEYRVHVVGNDIIHTQIKKIPTASLAGVTEEAKQDIFTLRNFDNGWRYSTDTDLPGPVFTAASSFISAINRKRTTGVHIPDVYALDIVYNSRHACAYILEANRAPGLSEVTVEKYADAFIANGVRT